jgi:diguanylate cyclase (GGDEF)-like protein
MVESAYLPMTSKRSHVAGWLGDARWFGPAVTAAVIGFALSAFAWLAVAAWEDRVAKQDFRQSAGEGAQALQTGLDDYLQKLVALRAFFNGSQSVTRNEFNIFTKDLLDERNAILSFSWIPRITREWRVDHELEGLREGIPNYHIKAVGPDGRMSPAPSQDEYFPVFYSKEPLTARIYGINLLDGGVRQWPLYRARDGDRLAASGKFRLQSGSRDQNGFFVVLPVYRQGLPHDTLDERRRNLVGFVQGVFQFNVLVDDILADVKSYLNILVFEADAGPSDLPVHVHGTDAGQAHLLPMAQAMAVEPSWVGSLSAGDRRWKLVIMPPAGASSLARHDRAWIVLCAGLLITGLVVAYIWNSIRHVRRLQATNNTVSALARTDALTGLANRRAFVEQITKAFAGVTRGNIPFAVHFIDLDDFKDINDTQGHATGDELLKEVAARLKAVIRSNDLVARFGGDEFAILQADVIDPSAAGVLAGKVLKTLASPHAINGVDLHVTGSIGIALHSEQIDGPKAIMMQTDLALYRAKDDGGDCFRFHSGELDQQVHLRVNLAEELRTAIEHKEMELYYQTQVEIRSGRIVGLEALARWNHPTRGAVSPSIFIPVAEHTGGIAALGQWVLATACRQFREWEDMGLTVPRLGINVSGGQLKRPSNFERDVAENFALWDIPLHAIEFELTETVLMEVTQKQSDALERLRQLGTTIAIDDFGTGYSSLRYLTTYPVHRLKIAGELIAGITSDSRSAVVVRSSIRLAHDLGIEVIAEGVERADQARFLLEAGCEYAQGYFYSRPMPADDVERLLSRTSVVRLEKPQVRATSSAA